MQKEPTVSKPFGSSPSHSDRLKGALEEKFVHIYRDIFSGCSPIQSTKQKGIHGHATLARFWDELLLLKVNESFLSQCISKASEEQLKGELKPIINELFGTSIIYLADGNFIRVAHALETLAILFREIFKKRFTEQGYTIITLVAGSVDNADSFFKRLITSVAGLLLRDDVPIPIKSLCLRLYFTILAATDNINTNAIASYFFLHNVFDSILAALTVKLSGDRKFLELDATLVLSLLLLWRESENIYSGYISALTTPLGSLLQTVNSLLALTGNTLGASSTNNSLLSSRWSVTDGVLGFFSSLFGFGSATQSSGPLENITCAESSFSSSVISADSINEIWLNRTAGLLLMYFLVYLCPAVSSGQVWPSFNDMTTQSSVGSSVVSLSSLWSQVLKAFLIICKETFSMLPKAGTAQVLRAKLCLTLLRCILEGNTSAQFLAHCDVNRLILKQAPSGITGIPYVIPFKSLSCMMVDFAAGILNLSPESPLDPDLFYHAAVLIPINFNFLKLRGWQLSSSSIDWVSLWRGLTNTCRWTSEKKNFQRPGVPELAELALGILESCLGNSQDLCPEPEETERLHALILANMESFEQLVETAALVPFGEVGKSSTRSGLQLVNVSALKLHYEIQIAALGVRGKPTYEQALQGVKKKGLANLKLKPRHAGPSHSYVEGTTELRLLINIARFLKAERHKQSLLSTPKLEVETR